VVRRVEFTAGDDLPAQRFGYMHDGIYVGTAASFSSAASSGRSQCLHPIVSVGEFA
jgi:hypothetical protein